MSNKSALASKNSRADRAGDCSAVRELGSNKNTTAFMPGGAFATVLTYRMFTDSVIPNALVIYHIWRAFLLVFPV